VCIQHTRELLGSRRMQRDLQRGVADVSITSRTCVSPDVFGRRVGTIGYELLVQGTEVKELFAVERLWKTARDSELFVSETEADKNCTGLNCEQWETMGIRTVRTRQEEDKELWFMEQMDSV
jgi:hypothetical protein